MVTSYPPPVFLKLSRMTQSDSNRIHAVNKYTGGEDPSRPAPPGGSGKLYDVVAVPESCPPGQRPNFKFVFEFLMGKNLLEFLSSYWRSKGRAVSGLVRDLAFFSILTICASKPNLTQMPS